MSAWHKALKNVWKSDPYISCWVECRHRDDDSRFEYPDGAWGERNPNPCDGMFEVSEYCLTKLELIKNAKAKGWTYDEDGSWLCPVCSKGGE